MSIRRMWSRLIKLLGIRWSIHPLFVLVMAASLLTGYFVELLVLFSIVLIHEAGHVLAAQSFGWRIREVRLLPFGGVAETEEAGTVSAWEEAVVAAAGPLQNIWMGAAAWALGEWAGFDAGWADYILKANLMIGLFNLLPVLPLDGGKLLSALLSCTSSYYRSLYMCTRLSLAVSLTMIMYACYLPAHHGAIQLNLLAISIFLFVSNWTFLRHIPYVYVRFLMHRELSAARMKDSNAHPILVRPRDSVGDVLRRLRRGRYHLICLIEDKGSVQGVIPEEHIIQAYLTEGKPGRAVSELFR
ncbi:site-2 protease family protein [Paenibacillus tarimensis]|uniref:site-2 protease family protein n=1 Tax=Paenibacillus tarimensis TaxID=416012 RepID=UPI001F236DC9|nr:site-2 protease family protein [Paenibacillus tarimensis]MCF2943958.1 site-2 protease family protein [Paenibacillus tarimensis]